MSTSTALAAGAAVNQSPIQVTVTIVPTMKTETGL